jgi:hypothetical protein
MNGIASDTTRLKENAMFRFGLTYQQALKNHSHLEALWEDLSSFTGGEMIVEVEGPQVGPHEFGDRVEDCFPWQLAEAVGPCGGDDHAKFTFRAIVKTNAAGTRATRYVMYVRNWTKVDVARAIRQQLPVGARGQFDDALMKAARRLRTAGADLIQKAGEQFQAAGALLSVVAEPVMADSHAIFSVLTTPSAYPGPGPTENQPPEAP